MWSPLSFSIVQWDEAPMSSLRTWLSLISSERFAQKTVRSVFEGASTECLQKPLLELARSSSCICLRALKFHHLSASRCWASETANTPNDIALTSLTVLCRIPSKCRPVPQSRDQTSLQWVFICPLKPNQALFHTHTPDGQVGTCLCEHFGHARG